MDTEINQVAIFLTSVAYYRVFIEGSDILPDSYAGHSVGEYAALVCSGAMVKDGTDVSISTYNDIRQIVISGRKGALKSAGERFEAAGAKTKMLEVKTAFHIPCMNEIIEPLKELISSFEITFPKGKASKSVDEIYEYLPIQVRECVRFYDIACEMIEDGTEVFIEAGRGKVLSNLLKKNKRGDYEVYPWVI